MADSGSPSQPQGFADVIFSTNAVGALSVFREPGSDVIDFGVATGNLDHRGWRRLERGPDDIATGTGNELILGNGGNDVINPSFGAGWCVGQSRAPTLALTASRNAVISAGDLRW
jgi:hypothetical protein